LRWEEYDGTSIKIVRSVWETYVTEPKTPESIQTIKVPGPLKHLLDHFHELQHYPKEGWIFKGSRDGKPLNLNDRANLVIRPVLRKLGVYHALKWFRNDSASHIANLRGDGMGAKALLRHTMDSDADRFYLKTMAEARDRAVGEVESIWAELPKQLTAGDFAADMTLSMQ
jgi:hypothetical protein